MASRLGLSCGLFDLTAQNVPEYLVSRGIAAEPWRVRELGGGVSNTVLLVEGAERRLVVKQSLAKLRVEQDWYSDRERIHREAGALRALAPHWPPGAVPEVLFEDPPNCLFGMTAAPPGAVTWKALLLAGDVESGVAARVGAMLASLVRLSWRKPEWEAPFADLTVFDQLRLDPYYRATARRHPDLAPALHRLVALARERRFSLVHGDWSPKNFLVGGGVMAIDFEVVHYGDPAFDSAFLLNHLLLKSFYLPGCRAALAEAARAFWSEYRCGLPEDAAWIETATVEHLGGLLLARIDGKSPAEYIRDPALAERVRRFARVLIQDAPAGVGEVFERAARAAALPA
jgi:5-methylthioribose kinase